MPRILIADDNSNIQKMVTLAFEGAGIEVVSVSNGGAAIRALPDSSPDLVLADVFMPVRNGYEVCDFIKHEPRFSHVPVVLLVGAFDPLDEAEAQRVSADGILKKPFIPPEPLINMVKTLLIKAANERMEVPVAHGAQAAREEAAKPAAAAPAVAVEDFSDEPPEEFPALLEPDFGIHEETLAFGSLLEAAPAATQPPAEPSSPLASVLSAPAAEDEEGSLRPPAGNEFLGADIPELDSIVSSSDMLSEELLAHVPLENGIERPAPEPGAEADSAFPEFVPHFDSPVGEAAPEALGSPEEVPELSWDHAAAAAAVEPTVEPIDLEPLSEPGNGEVAAERTTEEAEPAAAELADSEPREALQESAESAAADIAPAIHLPIPVFPGSEKLWASPQITGSETEEKADDAKENAEIQHRAEPEPSPWPVPAPSAAAVTAVELAEAAIPAAEVFEPSAFELVAAEMKSDSFPAAPPVAPPVADVASLTAAPAAEVEPQAKQVDPELIEAVVTRIVARMQPTVIDVVTREILRPLVEALVRREIDKAQR